MRTTPAATCPGLMESNSEGRHRVARAVCRSKPKFAMRSAYSWTALRRPPSSTMFRFRTRLSCTRREPGSRSQPSAVVTALT